MRALPGDVAELVLGQLGAPVADRLRARIKDAEKLPPEALDAALTEFFDLLRIAERNPDVVELQKAKDEEAAKPPAPDDPMTQLRALKPELIFRALEGEPGPAVAMILSCLDPDPAAQVLRRLNPEVRAAA